MSIETKTFMTVSAKHADALGNLGYEVAYINGVLMAQIDRLPKEIIDFIKANGAQPPVQQVEPKPELKWGQGRSIKRTRVHSQNKLRFVPSKLKGRVRAHSMQEKIFHALSPGAEGTREELGADIARRLELPPKMVDQAMTAMIHVHKVFELTEDQPHSQVRVLKNKPVWGYETVVATGNDPGPVTLGSLRELVAKGVRQFAGEPLTRDELTDKIVAELTDGKVNRLRITQTLTWALNDGKLLRVVE